MMQHHSRRMYVPVLKWRQGEYRALQVLAPSVKALVMPLIEVPPIPWDYVQERPQKNLEEHLKPMPQQVRNSIEDLPFYIDLGLLDPADRMPSGEHPITALFRQLSCLSVIPVTGLDREIAYQDAVKDVNREFQMGVCLRVGLEELFADAFESRAESLLSILSTPVNEADLIVDLQAVDIAQSAVLRTALPLAWKAGDLGRWRSVVLLGTGFPIDLSEVSPGVGTIPRSEWLIWRSLSSRIHARFGDYSISHYDVRELDPRVMKVSASIRYTADSEWLIFRGRSLRDPRFGGFEQFRSLSAQIVNHPAYSGMAYSWGDRYIYDCALGSEEPPVVPRQGPGNLTVWRQVGTNHHITHVVRQLSSSALT